MATHVPANLNLHLNLHLNPVQWVVTRWGGVGIYAVYLLDGKGSSLGYFSIYSLSGESGEGNGGWPVGVRYYTEQGYRLH